MESQKPSQVKPSHCLEELPPGNGISSAPIRKKSGHRPATLVPRSKTELQFYQLFRWLTNFKGQSSPPICFLLFICLVMQQCSSEEHGFILSRTFITALQTLESKALRMNKCRLSSKTNLQTLAWMNKYETSRTSGGYRWCVVRMLSERSPVFLNWHPETRQKPGNMTNVSTEHRAQSTDGTELRECGP